MNQEPDAGVLGADTEEWPVPDSGGDEAAVTEAHNQGGTAAHEGVWRDPAEPIGDQAWPDPGGPVTVIGGTQRMQPRHARPRDLRRGATTALGVALVIALGFALYFWLQLGSTRGEDDAQTTTPTAEELSGELEQANTRLAESEAELREAQVRVVEAEAEARELQEQLDAAVAASADAEDELADAAEQLKSVSDSLAAARSEGEALASAVLGSVDPVDACIRASAQVAQNVDQVGRGQLAQQAREAAATCAAAEESLAPAVSQARGILTD